MALSTGSEGHERWRGWTLLVSLLITLSVAGGPAFAGNPPATFDTEETPLQKAIKKANLENANKKKDKLGPGEKKDKCAAAIAAGDEDDIAKWCDVAKHHSQKLGHQDFKHEDGKAAGRRVVTKTVLEFEGPNHKGKPGDVPVDKWPATKLKAFERKAAHAPGPVSEGSGRTLGSAYLPSSADNEDRDCVDWVTGERHGASSCFDEDGKLLATLTAKGQTGCTHIGGSAFFGNATDGVEDDCWDAANQLKTTLVESIDEDGPDAFDNDGDGEVGEDPPGGGNEDGDCIAANGEIFHGSACNGKGPFGETYLALVDEDGPDAVDNDGDGRINEDGPAAQTEDDCQRLYRKAGLTPKDSDKDPDGQCDIGRALAKYVNDKAGKKVFKIKDDGTYDPEGKDGVEPGTESRRITLTESFGVKCKKGTTYVDGVCVSDAELEAMGGPARFQAAMRLIGGPSTSGDSDDPDLARVAMMGFTFAPPVIEWGYRISEDVCVLGICVEVFYARIGYEFDLALGLRLPVEIEVLDQPESVLAGRDVTLQTQVEPLDFRASEFEAFCKAHGLADGLLISDCKRFGFPDFLDEAFSAVISDAKKDGDEFVARYTAFAGVQVRVLGIPIINWALDSSIDVPAACTIARLIELAKDPSISPDQIAAIFDLIITGGSNTTEENAIAVLDLIKDAASACGTFTTPFGIDTEDSPPSLRTFPAAKGIDIRADCAQAIIEKEVITIGGKPRPICTNLILGVSGASLGIGLGLEASVGSRLIEGSFSTAEDATRSGAVHWEKSSNESGAQVGVTIRPDNYDARDFKDTAKVTLDDFTYFLNALQISLSASLQFGGILEPIPDIGSFTIFNLIISTGQYGIPIPQHPGTEGIGVDIPVENYGLEMTVHPTSDPNTDTLLIKPGQFGDYDVRVRNIGSRTGAFDFFRVALSNRPDQTAPFAYGIDPNTDHDCVSAGSTCTRGATYFFGDPYDGVADPCFDAAGNILSGRMACIDEDPPSAKEGLSRQERDDDGDGTPDEDPPEEWKTSPDGPDFEQRRIEGVAPYTSSSPLRIAVQPFRHPLTRPGIYPIKITGDSVEAKANSMASPDPSGKARRNAIDESFVKVDTFFEPQVVILNNANSGKPGSAFDYTIEGTNGGNEKDSMSVKLDFLDFNRAGCTLTTLGTGADCPYRAVPTAIPSAAWTTASTVSPILPDPPALLEPLGGTTDVFRITVPRDWAGMGDTTYRFKVTTVSQKDPEVPAATQNFTALHTVIATKESMTRYIGLEIEDLIATLTAAEAAGVKLGGLKPITVHPIRQMNESALAAILAGNFAKASNNHATSIQLVQAFVKALDGGGKTLPPALFADLHKRAAAMLKDLAMAEASTVPSL